MWWVLAEGLDLMVLKVFPNLNDFMILVLLLDFFTASALPQGLSLGHGPRELSQVYSARGLFPQLLVQVHSVGASSELPLCHLPM